MEQHALAQAVRQWLKTNERTQKYLAARVGVSHTIINNLLKGRKRISEEVTERIVAYINAH